MLSDFFEDWLKTTDGMAAWDIMKNANHLPDAAGKLERLWEKFKITKR